MRLGILLRAVEEIAGLQPDLAAVDEREGPDPVPLGLEGELRRVERLVGAAREHRLDLARERVILGSRAVHDHQPVTAFVGRRLDDHVLAGQACPVELDLVLTAPVARALLLQKEVIRSLIPDRHRPGAVAVGDDAVEREVLDGMILGMYREPALARCERRPLRDRK